MCLQGMVDEILKLFPETVKVLLSLEILHLQSLIALRVQAIYNQRFQNVAF